MIAGTDIKESHIIYIMLAKPNKDWKLSNMKKAGASDAPSGMNQKSSSQASETFPSVDNSIIPIFKKEK